MTIMYLNGRANFDLDTAIQWLQNAQEADHPDAKTYTNHARKVRSSQNLFNGALQRDSKDSVTLSKDDYEGLKK